MLEEQGLKPWVSPREGQHKVESWQSQIASWGEQVAEWLREGNKWMAKNEPRDLNYGWL